MLLMNPQREKGGMDSESHWTQMDLLLGYLHPYGPDIGQFPWNLRISSSPLPSQLYILERPCFEGRSFLQMQDRSYCRIGV